MTSKNPLLVRIAELEQALELLSVRCDRAEDERDDALDRVVDLTEKLEVMQYRVDQMCRRAFGSKAETYIPGQQILDEVAAMQAAAESDATGETPPGAGWTGVAVIVSADTGSAGDNTPTNTTTDQTIKSRKKRKPNRGRLALPETLDLEVKYLTVPEHERIGLDGKPLSMLREEITWKLDYRAPGFIRLKLIKPIYGIPFSDEPRISAPPLPCVVPHGLPTDAIVALLLTEKYDFHSPLFRQQTRFDRSGLSISRATLMNWIGAGATALEPVVTAIARSVRSKPVVALDDTYLPVLEPGKGRTHQSHLWGYYADSEFICEYHRSREARWPETFLEHYQGTLLGDAYSGHHQLFRRSGITAASCWAHARRKFEEAFKNGEKIAGQALDWFFELFALERLPSMKWASDDDRLRQRQRLAVPVIDRLEQLLTGWMTTQRPSCGVRKACEYTLKIYPQLRQYTRDGGVPIDNNALERCWRGIGIGRRNWLFAGSDRGGQWMATMVSLCQSCRLVGVDPFPYFQHIFNAIHAGRPDFDALTPKVFSQRTKQVSSQA